jgi:hypothetical protein
MLVVSKTFAAQAKVRYQHFGRHIACAGQKGCRRCGSDLATTLEHWQWKQ